MTALAFIVIMALLNRVRGGGFGGASLPGHPRWWVTVGVLWTALWVLPVPQAFVFAVGYLLWCLPPWGHLIGLGRYAPDRPASRLEAILLKMALGCVYGALWLRHWLILPMVLAITQTPSAAFLAPAIAMFIVLAYEAGWRLTPAAPIRTAEILTGVILGLLLLAGCAPDVNAYYVKGGSTGPIHCKGACP